MHLYLHLLGFRKSFTHLMHMILWEVALL